jgi:hypothetical protein
MSKRKERAEYLRQREEQRKADDFRFKARVFIGGWVLVLAVNFWAGGCDNLADALPKGCPDGRDHSGECV